MPGFEQNFLSEIKTSGASGTAPTTFTAAEVAELSRLYNHVDRACAA
jgi:hypothetical protein